MAWVIEDLKLWSLTDKDEVGNPGNLRLRSGVNREVEIPTVHRILITF